jgi:hypothetical protein
MEVNTTNQTRNTKNLRSALLITFAYAWLLFGLFSAIVYPESHWQATFGVLIISQTFCGVLAWRRFNMTRAAALPDFLTIYLFTRFASKTITIFATIASVNQDGMGKIAERLFELTPIPLQHQFRAEIVFLAAIITFTLVWIRLERGSIQALWYAPSPKVLWWTYKATFGLYLFLYITENGRSLGIIEDLLRLLSIGAIAVLLGGNTHYALGRRHCWLPLVALLPFFYLALLTGMKSEIGIVSLPILLPIVRQLTLKRMFLLIIFILFLILFVFPFSQAWRQINWLAQEGVGIFGVATEVGRQLSGTGLLAIAAESISHWLLRGSSSQQGGLVMQLAERDGFLGPILIEGLMGIFIPRFLWSEKPLYMPGAWFTWYLGYAASPEEATTSTAMMLPTELYWMFGAAGVIIGMTILALLYFMCWRIIWHRSTKGVVPAIALFALLARSSNLEEAHTIYAISSPLIVIVYIIAFDHIQKIFWPYWTGAASTQRLRI